MIPTRAGFFTVLLALLCAGAAACGGSDGGAAATEQLPEFCGQGPTALRPPPDGRPSYTMRLQIAPAAGPVTGNMEVAFTPDLDTDRLVFRLWPNGGTLRRAGARLDVHGVRVDDAAARTQRPDPTTLVVPLTTPLVAGTPVTASLEFSLRVPRGAVDRISARGDELRLGSFYPILPWVAGNGWALDPPSSIPSETSTSPVADYDVTITTPSQLQVVATGVEDTPGHWTAHAVRDFAVAAGAFDVARERAQTPGDVDVTVAAAKGLAVDPHELAGQVLADLEQMARVYGAYPWPTYTVAVVPDLEGEGIEYPGLSFLGDAAGPQVVAHETAHQWFYGLVGNNQAADPFLDEAPTTWAAADVTGDLADWDSLPVPAVAGKQLAAPMTYWNRGSAQAYVLGVYAQGVQALNGLGSASGVRCALRRYVEQNAYQIARPGDLMAALSDVYPGAAHRFVIYGVQ